MDRIIELHNVGSYDIIVTIGQTDPSHIGLPDGCEPSTSVKSQGMASIKYTSGSGCVKIYIWTPTKNLTWCGIVPLSSSNATVPLFINPNTKKVTYSGMEIPECLETRPSREYFGTTTASQPKDGIDFVKVVMIITAFLVVYGVWELLSSR